MITPTLWRSTAVGLVLLASCSTQAPSSPTLAPAASVPLDHVDATIDTRDSAAALRVEEGKTVVLTIRADGTDSAHLHGYDITVPVGSNVEARVEFVATKTGRFELELHDKERVIGVIEVYPR